MLAFQSSPGRLVYQLNQIHRDISYRLLRPKHTPLLLLQNQVA